MLELGPGLGQGWVVVAGTVVVEVPDELVVAAWEMAVPTPNARPNDPAARAIAARGFLIRFNCCSLWCGLGCVDSCPLRQPPQAGNGMGTGWESAERSRGPGGLHAGLRWHEFV